MSAPCSPRPPRPLIVYDQFSPPDSLLFYKENVINSPNTQVSSASDSPISSPKPRRSSTNPSSPLTSRNFKTLNPESLNTSPLPIRNLKVPLFSFKNSLTPTSPQSYNSVSASPQSYNSCPTTPQPARSNNKSKAFNHELLTSLLNNSNNLDFKQMRENLKSNEQLDETIKNLIKDKAKFGISKETIIEGLKTIEKWVTPNSKYSYWDKKVQAPCKIAVINNTESDQGGAYFLLKSQKNVVGKFARIKPALFVNHQGDTRVVAWRSLNEIHCTELEKKINKTLANLPELKPHVIAGDPIAYFGNWTPRDVQTEKKKEELKEFDCCKIGFPLEYGSCFLNDFLLNKPSFGVALKRMTHLVKGLKLLHGVNIVHRDIKPENIMLSEDGLPKYIDWELSQEQGDCLRNNPGTFGFCAPELYKKTAVTKPVEIEPSQDIYSLAMTILCMLTGNEWIRKDITDRAINPDEKEEYFKKIEEYYNKNNAGFTEKDVKNVVGLLRSCLEDKPKYRLTAAKLYDELVSIVPKEIKNPDIFSLGNGVSPADLQNVAQYL